MVASAMVVNQITTDSCMAILSDLKITCLKCEGFRYQNRLLVHSAFVVKEAIQTTF